MKTEQQLSLVFVQQGAEKLVCTLREEPSAVAQCEARSDPAAGVGPAALAPWCRFLFDREVLPMG